MMGFLLDKFRRLLRNFYLLENKLSDISGHETYIISAETYQAKKKEKTKKAETNFGHEKLEL